jgi:hypothetical protein
LKEKFAAKSRRRKKSRMKLINYQNRWRETNVLKDILWQQILAQDRGKNNLLFARKIVKKNAAEHF